MRKFRIFNFNCNLIINLYNKKLKFYLMSSVFFCENCREEYNESEINKLFIKTEELNDKINFIKTQLLNNKLKKSISNNLLNIIENIDKSIDVIDETIILNGIIDNK